MIGISKFEVHINKREIDEAIVKTAKTVYAHYLDNIGLEKSLVEIKERVLDKTGIYIDAHRKRPPVPFKKLLIDILRKTSFVNKIDNNTYRLVIGNQEVLDREVPYWYIVNYGGIIGRGKTVYFKGIFSDGKPVEGGKGNTWFEGGSDAEGKSYLIKPNNPISPMHYLNYMASEFNREVRRFQKSMKNIKSKK